MGVRRLKVRNCIRQGTYRYKIANEDSEEVWQQLIGTFGPQRQFGNLDLYEIDTLQFLLRFSFTTGYLTLIQKKGCKQEQMDLFHGIVGFEE